MYGSGETVECFSNVAEKKKSRMAFSIIKMDNFTKILFDQFFLRRYL